MVNALAVQIEKFNCPYCNRQSASPGGIRFHVKTEHADKFQEFMDRYYVEMTERYKKMA